jgi:hypothetical protein
MRVQNEGTTAGQWAPVKMSSRINMPCKRMD